MRRRGPSSDTCCPLRSLPSTHATLHLASMTEVLGEEEEAQRRVEGRRGVEKRGRKKRRKGGKVEGGRKRCERQKRGEAREARVIRRHKERGGEGRQKYESGESNCVAWLKEDRRVVLGNRCKAQGGDRKTLPPVPLLHFLLPRVLFSGRLILVRFSKAMRVIHLVQMLV